MSNVERCPYCGRFMAYLDDAEWGERWVCAWQAKHILSDPATWSVDVLALGSDAVDVDGDPISGVVGAQRLTEDQLRMALGLTVDREVCTCHRDPDGTTYGGDFCPVHRVTDHEDGSAER